MSGTLLRTVVTQVGPDVADLLAGGVLILFADGAPPAAVDRALAGGTTDFTRLDLAGTMRGGTLHLVDSGLTGPAGRIDIAGSIDISASAADLLLTLHPQDGNPAPPAIGLALNGAFDALNRVPQLADLTRWRAAK